MARIGDELVNIVYNSVTNRIYVYRDTYIIKAYLGKLLWESIAVQDWCNQGGE